MTINAPCQEQLPALRALWQEAFGDSDEFLNMFEATAFDVERCRCVAIDGSVACALYWFDCSYRGERIAYLYAIATAKTYRGQGLCRALIEDTHRHLKELGYYGTVLVPSDKELFALYQKFGYRVCCRISELRCSASSDRAELRQVGVNEYARLRRELLPKSGIIQENENLRFLKAQAAFYAGDGFLLAARCEKNTLYGAELLGNTAAAPDVVRALGCVEGRFRTPGDDIPFAMYRPLGDEWHTPPSYFGLAFD